MPYPRVNWTLVGVGIFLLFCFSLVRSPLGFWGVKGKKGDFPIASTTLLSPGIRRTKKKKKRCNDLKALEINQNSWAFGNVSFHLVLIHVALWKLYLFSERKQIAYDLSRLPLNVWSKPFIFPHQTTIFGPTCCKHSLKPQVIEIQKEYRKIKWHFPKSPQEKKKKN